MYEINLFFMGILGLAVGSFLNVLIYRIPKNENIAFPASHCTTCNKPLKWWHNIPLFSYIFLGGKCSYCKEKISLQYPLVELTSTIIFIISYMKLDNFTQALLVSFIFDLLLALSVIDFRYKAVPDSLNLSALTLAVFTGSILSSFMDALLFAGGFTLLRFYVSFFAKKEALGEADIMIAATIGAMLGIKLGFVAIFLSAIIALPVFLIIGKKDIQVPFIPFLALSLWITYFFDTYFIKLINWLYT
jgi:leader peptidase (prepilin peptidase)/N-methyltransferase